MYNFERNFSYFIRKEVFVRKVPYIPPIQVVNKIRPIRNLICITRRQSRRQRSTDEGAAEVTKGGDDVAQSKNK